MKKILTLTSWQIFILLLLPFVFPDSYLGLLLTIIYEGLFTYCVYFLGHSLYEKLPAGHDLKIKRLDFHLFFAWVYITIVLILFKGGYNINQDNYKDFGLSIYLIVPLHIFTLYCIFYVIWFIAKSIATIQKNNVVGFGDYIGNFFLLLWFFPIGVWWIQPKVREIFSFNTEDSSYV